MDLNQLDHPGSLQRSMLDPAVEKNPSRLSISRYIETVRRKTQADTTRSTYYNPFQGCEVEIRPGRLKLLGLSGVAWRTIPTRGIVAVSKLTTA